MHSALRIFQLCAHWRVCNADSSIPCGDTIHVRTLYTGFSLRIRYHNMNFTHPDTQIPTTLMPSPHAQATITVHLLYNPDTSPQLRPRRSVTARLWASSPSTSAILATVGPSTCSPS